MSKTRGEQRADEIDISPTALLAQIERLQEELEAARREKDEFVLALQRERAEFLNFKRRSEQEREAMLGLAGEDLIRKVLGLADDFDRALEARPEAITDDPWVEGVAAIDRKLRGLLESEGLTAIDATAGRSFSPHEHEAVTSIPGTGLPDGTIAAELRRGYRLRDRVIRPALVAVADGPPPGPGAGPTTSGSPTDTTSPSDRTN